MEEALLVTRLKPSDVDGNMVIWVAFMWRASSLVKQAKDDLMLIIHAIDKGVAVLESNRHELSK